MKGLVGVVLGACCAMIIACASASKSASTGAVPPTMQPGAQQGPMPGSPQEQQIDELYKRLETDRQSLDLPAPATPFSCAGTACSQGAQEMAAGATTPTQVCKPASTDVCTQSCTLADSICSNAKQICELAGKLEGDQWAAKKCSDGSETCKAAKHSCCECSK